MEYPVKVSRDDNGTMLVEFVDFPEAHTFGDDLEDALGHAADALATAIDAYIKDRRDIPAPSAVRRGQYLVRVPVLVGAKMRLYDTMREKKVGKAQLAKRLHCHLPQVDRLLTMTHHSKLNQLESAFYALGKRMVFEVEDAEEQAQPKRQRRRHAAHAR
jgi:antitoxin HicB